MQASEELTGLAKEAAIESWKEAAREAARRADILSQMGAHKQIVKRIDANISMGFNVCMWPPTIEQKDVNDMVLAGVKPADIKLMIDQNTSAGLQAKLNLAQWRKC